MRDVKKWIHDFDNLEPEQQFEIALAISNHILNGESRIDFREFDEERYEFISSVLSVIKSLSDEKNMLNSGILEKFRRLSQKKRLDIANQTYRVIDFIYQGEETAKKEAICEKEGHKFSKWEYTETQKIGFSNDARFLQTHPTGKYTYTQYTWTRRCSFCGKVERVHTEPEEAKADRLENERQEEIKNLKRRLRKLEGK